jgi:uncharacterized protein (DUF488 family)
MCILVQPEEEAAVKIEREFLEGILMRRSATIVWIENRGLIIEVTPQRAVRKFIIKV